MAGDPTAEAFPPLCRVAGHGVRCGASCGRPRTVHHRHGLAQRVPTDAVEASALVRAPRAHAWGLVARPTCASLRPSWSC